MPARNIYHDVVIEALQADGWTVTDDPLMLSFGGRNGFVDLGAERVIGAERLGKRIAVEIQSFLGRSEVRDLSAAVGQFAMYRTLLQHSEPDRVLFIAVHLEVASGIFAEPFGQLIAKHNQIRLLVFDVKTKRIVQWIE